MNLSKFFGELKRRHVYKVAVAYVVAGWALAQGIAQVFPVFDIPNWVVRLIVLLIILGLPVALVLAWVFEITPEGIKRSEDVDLSAGGVPKKRTWIYIVVIGAAFSIGLFFIGRYAARTSNSASSNELSEKSIAVLPFENLSSDRENAYFVEIWPNDTNLVGLIIGLDVFPRRQEAPQVSSAMCLRQTTSFIYRSFLRNANDREGIPDQAATLVRGSGSDRARGYMNSDSYS